MRDLRRLLALFGFVVGLVAVVAMSALPSGPYRSDYAFVESGSRTSFVESTTETPMLFVIGVSVVCALVGWFVGSLLIRRGWTLR
ncbi:hypothetical protein CH263_24295 [Rhodococcus sp. 06-1059B-a]|nr:hypothetical protein [Rhodococcus sp. 06-1059B-a]OZD58387.1 hypothetical protein CH263_24295 [Rhodococcus sp. 06-1059B-a]